MKRKPEDKLSIVIYWSQRNGLYAACCNEADLLTDGKTPEEALRKLLKARQKWAKSVKKADIPQPHTLEKWMDEAASMDRLLEKLGLPRVSELQESRA